MANLVSSARIRYETLRSVDSIDISADYEGVGSPFENPVRILKVTNLTNGNVLISFNGIDDHDIVPANGAYVYDYGTNRSSTGSLLEQSAFDRLYVKAEDDLPDTGILYVTVIYASQV